MNPGPQAHRKRLVRHSGAGISPRDGDSGLNERVTQFGASGVPLRLLGVHTTIAETVAGPQSSLPSLVALLIAVALAVIVVMTAFALLITLAALVMAVAAALVALRAAAAVAVVVTVAGAVSAVAGALVAIVCVVVPVGLCMASAVALTVRMSTRSQRLQAVADRPPLERTATAPAERPDARIPASATSRIPGAA